MDNDEKIVWPTGDRSSFGWQKTPRQAGIKSGRQLNAPSTNPYPEGTKSAADWERGWRQGSQETLRKRDLERKASNG